MRARIAVMPEPSRITRGNPGLSGIVRALAAEQEGVRRPSAALGPRRARVDDRSTRCAPARCTGSHPGVYSVDRPRAAERGRAPPQCAVRRGPRRVPESRHSGVALADHPRAADRDRGRHAATTSAAATRRRRPQRRASAARPSPAPCSTSPRSYTQRALLRALAEAEFQHDLRPDDVLRTLRRGHPGSANLRAALDAHAPGYGQAKSRLERRFRALLIRHGIELPERNQRVGPYEVDCLWRDRRVVVELDGRQHTRPHQADADDDRDLWLRAPPLRPAPLRDQAGRRPARQRDRRRARRVRRRRETRILTLRWAERVDSLDLRYRARSALSG